MYYNGTTVIKFSQKNTQNYVSVNNLNHVHFGKHAENFHTLNCSWVLLNNAIHTITWCFLSEIPKGQSSGNKIYIISRHIGIGGCGTCTFFVPLSKLNIAVQRNESD